MNEILHKIDLGIITFGIYKNKKWSELPKEYLQFLISDKCFISKENKQKAKQELNNRTFLDGQISLF